MSDERLPVVKVRRDGGRGWHWINQRDFDAAVHQLLDEAGEAVSAAPEPVMPAPKRRGRPPKVKQEP